jgi:hypothetical protein
MSPEHIHLLGLVALRALADYDPVEFRRSTDLSKREIDERIDRMLSTAEEFEEDEETYEIRARVERLRSVEREAESQVELSFLLRQLSMSSLQRAHQLALRYSRSAGPRNRDPRQDATSTISVLNSRPVIPEVEYLRLAVMRLLRELPEYRPIFEYAWRNKFIDCFLEPRVKGFPPILIEGKRQIRSIEEAKRVIAQLKQAASGWGRDALAVVITTSVSSSLAEAWPEWARQTYLLVFDPEANEFAQGVERFISGVKDKAASRG